MIKIDKLRHNQLLAEALLPNEMRRYISICMKVKVGIIGKIEIRHTYQSLACETDTESPYEEFLV